MSSEPEPSDAGATVYCTGRSVRDAPSDYERPETIEETAELIQAAGGTAHAVRVDHSSEAEVERFFADLDAARRLDVLVDSVAGEHPIMRQWCSFWETDVSKAEAVLREGFLTHVSSSRTESPRSRSLRAFCVPSACSSTSA